MKSVFNQYQLPNSHWAKTKNKEYILWCGYVSFCTMFNLRIDVTISRLN